MNNTKLNCSLNDTTILRNLILENPELPLLVFCGEDAWSGEYGYEQVGVNKVEIEELTLCGDMWLNKEDYKERISDNIFCEKEYVNMPDEDFDELLNEKVTIAEFVKAIVIWVG